jgi:hypothetical protein
MAQHRFIFKTTAALLLGVYLTILYLQTSDRFIAIAQSELKKQFLTQLGVKFQGKLKSINLLTLNLEFTDASFVPVNQQDGWKWRADEFNMNLSWFSFLYRKLFALDIVFKKYEVSTTIVKGRLSVMDHIKKVIGSMQNMPLPIALRSIMFQQAKMNIQGGQNINTVLYWNGQLGKAGSLYKSRFYLVDGSITVGVTQVASKMSGITSITLQPGIPLHYRITNDLQMNIDHLPEGKQVCVLEGTWDDSQGACVLNNHDYSFHVDPIRTCCHANQFMVEGTITVPLSYFGKIFGGNFIAEKTNGTCDVSFVGDPAGQISGMVTINDPAYEGYGLENVSLSFLTDGIAARGSLRAHKQGGRFAGAWSVDTVTKTCKADLVNHTTWPISQKGYWEIPPHEGRVSFSFNQNSKTNADYRIAVQHKKTESIVQSKGSCTVSPSGKLYALGDIDHKKYSVNLQLFPDFKPLSVLYKDKNEKSLLHVSMRPPYYKEVKATLSYDFIRSMIQDYFDYDLSGQGMFHVSGVYDKQQLEARIYSEDTTIRLPEMYNFISSISGDCTVQSSPLRMQLKNFTAQFHKGSLTCSNALIHLNDRLEPTFLHVPVRIDKCFLNWRDDFFAVTSGSCVLQKRLTEPYSIDGFVVIEKGQLKENPLSQQGQREVTQFMLPSSLFSDKDLKVHIGLMTRDPLYIKTPQLQSRAVIDVELSNTPRNPKLSGKLKLLGGVLHFPYRPLYITRSELQFFKDQPYDPIVDFIAQGTIKKYAVTLSVSGTLQDPQITVSSVPSLSEEQIIALLFTGSIEESLNVMVPTLVMRNIEALVFGSASQRASEHWLDPLKKIRIVPSFTDQTGRGGFRGALEIDVSDHLHAKLQKNFSLSEDTRIEIEYLVSDDMSLKVLKDERSDIGAEVEMRFKF